MSRRVLLICVAGLAALLLPATAKALSSPTLVSVGQVKRHPSAQWILPPNVEAWSVEVATSPETASDGSFFTENVVDFDTVEKADIQWLAADRLAPGVYYIHVHGWDNSCFTPPYTGECGAVWSNILGLKIVNRKPTIRALHWSLRGHGAPRSYYVTVSVRLRVCDDVDELITSYRDERKHVGGYTVARSRTSDYGRRRRAGCNVVRWTWRLEDKFFGVGNYTVRLWVRDADGAKSRAVAHSWFTSD